MPIHDWTRVDDGTFHSFHLSWIAAINRALNTGILPDTYYALAEQLVGHMGPDVLALQMQVDEPEADNADSEGGLAVAVAPKLRVAAESSMDYYTSKRRTIVIRHVTRDRVVALLEIVSPGNKGNVRSIETFVDKAVEAISRGYHLGVVDLFPVGPRDPKGIHHLIWSEIDRTPAYELPADEPLTQATYYAGNPKNAFIEPTAVGRELIDLPVFLEWDLSVLVPLESTYQEAFRGMPKKWRQVLEAGV